MVTGEDIKDLKKILKIIETAKFNVSMNEIYSIFIQMQKFGDFIEKCEQSLSAPPISISPVSTPLKGVKNK